MNMNKSCLSIDIWHTTYDEQYNIVNDEGCVIAIAYNKQHAEIIRKALSTYAG